MTIKTAIWTIEKSPRALPTAQLESENELEAMIIAAPAILSDELMLIGQQVDTGFGGRIDLLAIAPDGSLILVELKRNRTPRDVVAQALDYAAFVQGLEPDAIAAIYARYAPGRDLKTDFQCRFGTTLDEETLNDNHQIMIVASSIDEPTTRIVRYLSERDVAINILCFQVFEANGQKLLTRSWLLDPRETQASASVKPTREREPWNGELYASFGDGPSRNWEEARKYGFISAGGGTWYTNTLQLLNPGDRVWVKVPKHGYVGVCRVKGTAVPSAQFEIETPDGLKPALEVLNGGHYYRHNVDDPEKAEHFVPVEWLHAVPLGEAIHELGMFGNQNTVCKPVTPSWRLTVDRLKQRFGVE